MCGRFAQNKPAADLKRHYNTVNAVEYSASYNVAPSQLIISILEHYSEQDCALLLGCSVQEVRQARARALQRMAISARAALARERLIDSDPDRGSVLVEDAHKINQMTHAAQFALAHGAALLWR